MTTETTTTPHIFRCGTCLETYASQERYPAGSQFIKCACGAAARWEGQVNNGRLIFTAQAPACDDRCLTATGKTCSCQCGGRNHGTWRTVTVTRDEGGAPKVASNIDEAACRQRRQELEAAVKAARTRLEERVGAEVLATSRGGGWVSDRNAWEDIRETDNAIHAAYRLKTHNGRLARLARA